MLSINSNVSKPLASASALTLKIGFDAEAEVKTLASVLAYGGGVA